MHDLLMTSTPIPSDGVTKHRTIDQDEMEFPSVGGIRSATSGHCSTMTTVTGPSEEARILAERTADALHDTKKTIAAAESITCGNIAAGLAAAPDASQWFRGAVVAYGREVKFSLLGVDPGPVITSSCVEQMAVNVRRLLGADIAVATTGAGGPGREEGQPAGTVFIGIATRDGCSIRECHFFGEPSDIVHKATVQALRDLAEAVLEDPRSQGQSAPQQSQQRTGAAISAE
jgi:nicotinamide-nucleotide amidase